MSVKEPRAAAVPPHIAKGLEDIVVGVSSISDVRGREGQLIYRGYDIHDLAKYSTFEEATYLLWNGVLPTRSQLQSFCSELAHARDLPEGAWPILESLPRTGHMMDTLNTAVSILGVFNPDAGDTSPEANRRQAIRLTAQMGTLAANLARLREGRGIHRPNPGFDTATDFLSMYFGQKPDEATAHLLDVILILHADHEFNASTFAGRIAASTLSDMYSVVVAALAVLEGPLHGGANEKVMKMLEEIGEPERAEAFITERLAKKQKVMGFGHRVYKTEDPRATHLREFSRELAQRTGDARWFEISRRLEEVMLREKGLHPNVDFYSASVYHYLGFPTYLYTPLFAVSRVSGYAAHAMEQYADNRLIRPRSFYVGPAHCDYPPIDFRREAGQGVT